jgi:hypothetical protein
VLGRLRTKAWHCWPIPAGKMAHDTGRWQGFLGEHEEASRVAPCNRRGSGAHPNGMASVQAENRTGGGGFNVSGDLQWVAATVEGTCSTGEPRGR